MLLQDAALKFFDKDLKGSGAAFKEVLKKSPSEVRALAGLAQVYAAQGQKGVGYQFGPNQHHGAPDQRFFVFTEVTDKGTKLIPPDLSKVKPKN